MTEDELWGTIDGFHPLSFYAGASFAFAEAVSYGCKRLALSYPYSDEELAAMLGPTERLAEEFGLQTYVDGDFLVTPLFPASLTEGKSVILLAGGRNVIDEYLALKAQKAAAQARGNGKAGELELARRLGRLLSYSDDAIRRLIAADAG